MESKSKKVCEYFNRGIQECPYGSSCTLKHKISKKNGLKGIRVSGAGRICGAYSGVKCGLISCTLYHDPFRASYNYLYNAKNGFWTNPNSEEILRNATIYENTLPLFGRKQKYIFNQCILADILPRGVNGIILDYLMISPRIIPMEKNGKRYTYKCGFCKIPQTYYTSHYIAYNSDSFIPVCSMCININETNNRKEIITQTNIITKLLDADGKTYAKVIGNLIKFNFANLSEIISFLGLEKYTLKPVGKNCVDGSNIELIHSPRSACKYEFPIVSTEIHLL